jgi:hypothetical protein
LDANFDSIGYIGSNWGQTLTSGQHDSLARITSSIMIVLLTNCAILALVASSTFCSLSLMLPWAAQHSHTQHSMWQHSRIQHSPKRKLLGWKHSALLSN